MSAADRIGHRYDPVVYSVTQAAIAAYVAAVEADAETYSDIAPPMFAVVYAGAAVGAGMFDPELGIDFARLVHGSQEFVWPGPVVRAGDEITTVLSVVEVRETAGLAFFGFGSESVNQHGQTVAVGDLVEHRAG